MTPSPPRSHKTRAAAPAAAPPPVERPFVAHKLVPPHELLSVNEGQSVLQELGMPVERMPKILVNDPGLKTDPKFREAREAHEPLNGRLVRVRRPSPTAGEAIAYRVIVSTLGE